MDQDSTVVFIQCLDALMRLVSLVQTFCWVLTKTGLLLLRKGDLELYMHPALLLSIILMTFWPSLTKIQIEEINWLAYVEVWHIWRMS